jgi:segregation and condensation protein A
MASDADSFEDPDPAHRQAPQQLVLDLDGYEGPIDVLLALARDQKVDLARISILQLADQYVTFVQEARRLRLELAAEYLVMAAWLAYLKSRMLLPDVTADDEPSGEELAELLAFQLRRLEAMREAGAVLLRRPQLGYDFFARGEPEGLATLNRTEYECSLYDLLRAYADHRQRKDAKTMTLTDFGVFSIDDALRRLGAMIGHVPDWSTLTNFLPPGLQGGLLSRSAMATTFAASLELVRSGRLELRQTQHFGPIYVRRRQPRDTGLGTGQSDEQDRDDSTAAGHD